MAAETVFSKIIAKEIPAKIVYEDKTVLAFYDKAPQAPVHLLIIPRQAIKTANDIKEPDERLIGHLFTVAAKLAAEL